MTELSDYHANGVSFPDSSRPDMSQLLDRIPSDGTLHLAILRQPYLNLIDDGTKTIESRFNTNRAAPFGKVAVGDLVLLKGPGRPVTNYFFAAAANSFRISPENIDEVRREYGPGICAQNEDDFWREKSSSTHCTLVKIGDRGSIPDLLVTKKDQRGWVTFVQNNLDMNPTLF